MTSSTTDRRGLRQHHRRRADRARPPRRAASPTRCRAASWTSGGSAPSTAELTGANTDALFRDEQRTAATGVLFGVGLVLALADGRLSSTAGRAARSMRSCSSRCGCSGSSPRRPSRRRCTSGATAAPAAYWSFVIGVALVLGLGAWLAGRRRGGAVGSLVLALGGLGRVAPRRPGHRRAPRARRRVRLLGDHRHARRRHERGVRAARGGGALFAGLVAWRWPGRPRAGCPRRPARGDRAGRGPAVLRRRLRGGGGRALAFALCGWLLAGRRVRAWRGDRCRARVPRRASVVGLALSEAARSRRRSHTRPARCTRRCSTLVARRDGAGARRLLAVLWFIRPRAVARRSWPRCGPHRAVALALVVAALRSASCSRTPKSASRA